MALVGVELEMLVNEQDALTTRPPPCCCLFFYSQAYVTKKTNPINSEPDYSTVST